MSCETSDVFKFDLGSSFKVKRGYINLKVLLARLLLVLEGLQYETNIWETIS